MSPTLSASLLLSLLSADALACGGFFCDTNPVLQAQERIVFAVSPEQIEAHVQITYTGSARQFAWVVPTPGLPELFASTDKLFTVLDERTTPQFRLTVREEGSCLSDDDGEAFDTELDDTDGWLDTGARGVEVEGVMVVARQEVGPFDAATLQAENAENLVRWLQLNGYQIPPSYAEAVDPYIADEGYFVALRLLSDRDTGDLQPLGLRYAAPKPGVPLKLTSVAATPDMRVDVYVFGQSRAVPDNTLHVEINEAAVDWIGGGGNYEALITRAANEAGGHAFTTDYARSTYTLRGLVYTEGTFDFAALRALTHPADFVDALFRQGVPPTAGVMALLREHVPMPQSAIDARVNQESFYACVGCFREFLDGAPFDPDGLATALETEVIAPLRAAESLFTGHPYLTRLRSSFSPDEMTLDPTFVFNDTLPDVSHLRDADLIYACGDGLTRGDAPRRVELSNGRVVHMPSERQLRSERLSTEAYLDALNMPATERIARADETGPPEVVLDNEPRIDEILRSAAEDEGDVRASACGCQQPGGARGLVLVGLLPWALRRRARR